MRRELFQKLGTLAMYVEEKDYDQVGIFGNTRRIIVAKKTTTIGKSLEQEEFVAKFLDARRTVRSGATLSGGKGDITTPNALIECKTSMVEKDSFTVKREWLTKMQRERFEDRKEFAFLVQNFGGKGNQDNYVVMRIEDFKKLMDMYAKEEEL